MTPMIDTEDLCDSQVVAAMVGLRHANSVHTYQRRYSDMPRPVIDLGPGRTRLWLRPQIEAWVTTRTGPASTGSGSPGSGSPGSGSPGSGSTGSGGPGSRP